MNTLQRNNRPLYLCNKYVDIATNVTKYTKPSKQLWIDWQPINSDGEVYVFGVEYSKYISIKGNKEKWELFKNKDRVYVYKKPNLNDWDGNSKVL